MNKVLTNRGTTGQVDKYFHMLADLAPLIPHAHTKIFSLDARIQHGN